MRPAAIALGAGAGLLLTACGSPPPVVAPSPLGSSVSITAEPADCSSGPTGTLCTVRVWYANTSRSDVDIDPTGTELVDSTGAASFPVVNGDLPSGTHVAPGDKFAVTWSLTLPVDSTVSAVLWRAGDGQTQSAPLMLATTGSSPSPTPTPAASTPTPKPKPKPTPVVTPKPKPTPVVTRPATSSGSGSTKPPPSGSIG
jgi:hypothetical protein